MVIAQHIPVQGQTLPATWAYSTVMFYRRDAPVSHYQSLLSLKFVKKTKTTYSAGGWGGGGGGRAVNFQSHITSKHFLGSLR